MISNWRYDTTYTHNSGVECTDVLHNLPPDVIAGDYMKPYYMGYITYDNFPTNMMYTRIKVDNKDLVAEIPPARNHGWGYVLDSDTSYTPNSFMGYPNTSDILQRVGGTGSRTARFINSAIMSRYATANKITLTIRYIFIPESALDDNDSAYNLPDTYNNIYKVLTKTASFPFISTDALGDGFDKFYTNETPLDFGTQSVYGTDVPLTFVASDFGTDDNPTCRRVVTIGGTNYVMFAQLAFLDYPGYGRYRRPSDETPTKLMIAPFFEMDSFEYDETIAPSNRKWINVNVNTQQTIMRIEIDNAYGTDVETAVYADGGLTSNTIGFGNFFIKNGVMNHGTTDAYWYAANSPYHYPGYNREGIMMGRNITTSANSMDNIFDIYPFLRPKDVWFSVAPFHKIDTAHDGQTNVNPQNSYTTTYSTEIFDNNVPTETRKQDTTANLEEELMRWQVPSVDIIADDFIIDDMPSYEPSEDIMDKYTGASVALNTGKFGDVDNFLTFWVLDKTMVNQFGERLWKNLLDLSNYDPSDPSSIPAGAWENVKIAFSTYFQTGSFDPSSVMDFIISLRYYPFELYSLAPSTTPNTKIYFGTGKYGVDVTNPPHKLSNLAIDVPAGVIFIQDKDGYLYKDFRDYDGSMAVIYLPFCGEYQIPISEVEDQTQFNITYEVDILSGACTAYVLAIHPTGNGVKYYPILIANGQCGFDVPLSATNANRLNAQILGDAQRAIGGVLEPVKQAASKIGKDISSAGQMIMGGGHADLDIDGANYVGAVAGPLAGVGAEMALAAPKAGMNLINQASDMVTRPAVSMPLLQGSRGWAALSNPLKPYLQLRRARYLYPENYKHTMGKPECRTRKINTVKGYAECSNVDTSGLQCTEAEKQMIKRTLETGFYRK